MGPYQEADPGGERCPTSPCGDMMSESGELLPKVVLVQASCESDGGAGEEKQEDGYKGQENWHTFEQLLTLVGETGRWNYSVFLLLFIGPMISTFTVLPYQFLGATPDYWCHVQELHDANWTTKSILSLAIPRTVGGKLEGCLQRDYNYSLAASMGYEAAKNNLDLITLDGNGTVSCFRRDFNHTQYASTLVTEFDLVCDRRWLYSTTQAVVQIGKLFASLFIGYITDTVGKRRVLLFCPLLVFFFGMLGTLAPTIRLYIVCKFFASFFDMGIYVTCYVLALELSSKPQRSSVGSLYGIPWAIGSMIIAGTAYLVRKWKFLQIAFTAPYLLFLVYFWLLPESPRWLILRGHFGEAIRLLKRAASINGRELPPNEKLQSIMERIRRKDWEERGKPEHAMEGESSLRAVGNSLLGAGHQVVGLFRTRTMAKQTLIMFFCWFSVGFVYFGMAQNGTNMGSNEYWYLFLGGLLEIPPCVLMWPALAFLGRRRTLMILYGVSAVSIIGSLFVQESPKWAITLALIGRGSAINAFSMVYLFSAELNTTKSRTVAVGISSVVARFGSVSTPYLNDLIGASNPAAPSIMYGTVSCMAAVLVFFLPETRKHVLPESLAEVEGMSLKRVSESPSEDNNVKNAV